MISETVASLRPLFTGLSDSALSRAATLAASFIARDCWFSVRVNLAEQTVEGEVTPAYKHLVRLYATVVLYQWELRKAATSAGSTIKVGPASIAIEDEMYISVLLANANEEYLVAKQRHLNGEAIVSPASLANGG